MKPSRVPRFLIWLTGFCLATLLMTGLGRPFVESIVPWRYEPAIETFVPEAGYVHRFRQEGWANTEFGLYGIPAIADLKKVIGPATLIWGDSQVEAFQVDDKDKMAQQLSRLSQGQTTGVGIGRGGRQLGDYLRMMPMYEQLCDTELHVIVVPNLRDVYPDIRLEDGQNIFTFDAHPTVIAQKKFRRVMATFGLDFAFSAIKSFKKDGGLSSLRFRLGPASAPSPNEVPLPPFDLMAAGATASALRQATERPVLLLYIPTLPKLEPSGLRVEPLPQEIQDVSVLAEACLKAGVAFLDLSSDLVAAKQATGRFPRGFPNGAPSRGHLNPLGHRIAAEAILGHLATLERKE